jgi:tRNA A-37 threonylcarbamoyl transferase component Bud32
MSNETTVIPTDNVYWRATFRVLLLLMPYWLLLGGANFMYLLWAMLGTGERNAFSHLNEPVHLFSIPALFLALTMLFVCRTNFIRLGKDAIKLPWLCSIKFAELENVFPRFNNGKATHLQFVYGLGRSVLFPIDRFEGDRFQILIKELRDRCSAGVVADDLENVCEEKVSLAGSQGYRIDYLAREKMHKLFKLVVSFEKQFWRAWLLVFMTPVVLASPFLFWLFYCVATHSHGSPPFGEQLSGLYEALYHATLEPLLKGATDYCNLMKHPVLLGLGGCAILACLAAVGRIFLQPNLLVLSPEGLCLKLVVFGGEHERTKLAWSDITSFALFKPRDSTDTDHWSIQVRTTAQSLFLKFGALTTEVDRRKFAEGIDKYASHAAKDPELLQALAPANKRSYTELWLQSLAAPTERKNLVPLSCGQSLAGGRYVVEDQIGVGGQGVAYLACDRFAGDAVLTGASQKIVLKEFVLPVHVEKKVRQQSLERFEQESSILRTLDHPGIVKIVDNFVEDHRGYLVLEHIDGLSLRAIVAREGAMNEKLVTDLLGQMCSILEYVHSLSPPLVHRDFTPDNLILDKDGVVKLIDFNVAQQKQKGGTATVVGKHAYLPPEQFRGRPTTRSDIFALGCTLYFMLTGEDPEPLTQSSLPVDCKIESLCLDRIIQRCTALDELERYSGAAEIKEEILSKDSAVILSFPNAQTNKIELTKEKESVLVKEAQDG